MIERILNIGQTEIFTVSITFCKLAKETARLKPRLHQIHCSPDTSCIHLYPLSPSTCIHHTCIGDKIVANAALYGDMYPLVSDLDTSCSTGILVSGLQVSGVNAALETEKHEREG